MISLKNQVITILVVVTQTLNLPPVDHKIKIFCTMAITLHQIIRKTGGPKSRTATQITRPSTIMYQG